jgi:hypothetical protein
VSAGPDDPRQARLPAEAGAVRDLDIPHPAEALPPAAFTLTPPAETAHTQLTLTETDDRGDGRRKE